MNIARAIRDEVAYLKRTGKDAESAGYNLALNDILDIIDDYLDRNIQEAAAALFDQSRSTDL